MNEENAQAVDDGAEAAPVATTPAEAAADPSAATTMDSAPSDGADDTPTPEEARAMFAERPDAAGCLTTEGWMRRDSTFPS